MQEIDQMDFTNIEIDDQNVGPVSSSQIQQSQPIKVTGENLSIEVFDQPNARIFEEAVNI